MNNSPYEQLSDTHLVTRLQERNVRTSSYNFIVYLCRQCMVKPLLLLVGDVHVIIEKCIVITCHVMHAAVRKFCRATHKRILSNRVTRKPVILDRTRCTLTDTSRFVMVTLQLNFSQALEYHVSNAVMIETSWYKIGMLSAPFKSNRCVHYTE